jgi:hypothetical protein
LYTQAFSLPQSASVLHIPDVAPPLLVIPPLVVPPPAFIEPPELTEPPTPLEPPEVAPAVSPLVEPPAESPPMPEPPDGVPAIPLPASLEPAADVPAVPVPPAPLTLAPLTPPASLVRPSVLALPQPVDTAAAATNRSDETKWEQWRPRQEQEAVIMNSPAPLVSRAEKVDPMRSREGVGGRRTVEVALAQAAPHLPIRRAGKWFGLPG